MTLEAPLLFSAWASQACPRTVPRQGWALTALRRTLRHRHCGRPATAVSAAAAAAAAFHSEGAPRQRRRQRRRRNQQTAAGGQGHCHRSLLSPGAGAAP